MIKKLAFTVCCTLLTSHTLLAGGPLILEGANGDTPVTYPNPVITLHVEGGDLGTIPNADADALLLDAVELWNSVSTSTIDLNLNQTELNLDINLANYTTYLPFSNDLNADDNLNPIVYDSSGEIIDAFFGLGQSDTTIGVAASIFTSEANFIEGYAVINGKDNSLSDAEFKVLIAHELGHFFGLDHSQTNIDNDETLSPSTLCSSAAASSYAVMYPFVCRNIASLHQDDISAVSGLYPSSTLNQFFGTIEGLFLDENGNAVLGANIWAENTTSGTAVSVVSDYLTQNNGFYKLYLPAGNYTLHANSINPLFNGGSGIGPYTTSILDISYREPHPISPVSYLGTEGSEQVITVTAGQARKINFTTSGNDVTPSSSSDDESLSDIFGATSPLLLLSLLVAPAVLRRRHT